MASRFKILEEYVGELKEEKKWKHEEKDRVPEERFQKVGEWEKLSSKLEEYDSDILDQTLSQFYTFRNLVTVPS